MMSFREKENKQMNYIKDIELKTNNLYNAIIEIPKKTKNKYELEDGSSEKVVKVRRVKCKYPFYYGCFPQTLAGDNDHILAYLPYHLFLLLIHLLGY